MPKSISESSKDTHTHTRTETCTLTLSHFHTVSLLLCFFCYIAKMFYIHTFERSDCVLYTHMLVCATVLLAYCLLHMPSHTVILYDIHTHTPCCTSTHNTHMPCCTSTFNTHTHCYPGSIVHSYALLYTHSKTIAICQAPTLTNCSYQTTCHTIYTDLNIYEF